MMLPSNYLLHGRYRIIRPLGKGGFGQVYEALDDKLDCLVAIKERRASVDSDDMRRAFEREAKLLANLRHPVLPKVSDHFLEGDGQFLVMEFIEGDDLLTLLNKRQRPFSSTQILPWADELLKALEYLHSRSEKVIHRDIKPANIKIASAGEIFLLDFGLAKGSAGMMSIPDHGQGLTSVRGYTAAYAPIEQLSNSGTDEQSDLYSLGATLYHLLTGRIPVTAAQRYEKIDMGHPDPLPLAHEVNPEVPVPVSLVLSHAMAMSRRDRVSSAAKMRKALREARVEIERANATPARSTEAASHRQSGQYPTIPAPFWGSSEMPPTQQGSLSQLLTPPSEGQSAPPSTPSREASWPSQLGTQSKDSQWPSSVNDESAPTLLMTETGEEQSVAVKEQGRSEAEAVEPRLQEKPERRGAQEEAQRRAAAEARRAEEEAARLKAEEERLRLEAEAARQPAEQQQQQELPRRAEEEQRKATAEESRRRMEAERAGGQSAQTPMQPLNRMPTLPAQPPLYVSSPDLAGAPTSKQTPRRLIYGAVVVTALVLIGVLIFLLSRKGEPAAGLQPQGTTVKQGTTLSSAAAGPEDYSALTATHTLNEQGGKVWSVAFSPDGGMAAAAGEDKKVRIWETNSWQLNIAFGDQLGDINSIAFSPDRSLIASASSDQTIKLWNTKDGTPFRELKGHEGKVLFVAFSPDGKLLASASTDKTARLWEVETGKEVRRLKKHVDEVWSVAFSPDGATLVSAGKDRTIRLWNVETGEETRTIQTNGPIVLAFSADGTTLASGHSDKTIKLWNWKTGQPLKTLTGHKDYVTSLGFSPDGRLLASGSKDKSIKLWNVQTGEIRQTLLGHTDSVESVSFSPQGRTLISGSRDRTVKVWQ